MDSQGGLSYKNDGGARRKFWEEPLKGTESWLVGISQINFHP